MAATPGTGATPDRPAPADSNVSRSPANAGGETGGGTMIKQQKRGLFRAKNGLRVAAAAVVSALVLTLSPGSAYAISIPNPVSCAWNSTFGGQDFLWLKIPDYRSGTISPFCFVNAGTKWDVNVSGVGGLHSGNNEGLIEYKSGSTWYLQHFNKWHDDNGWYGYVAMLTIY
jgi:hypothetical protein